MKPCILIILVAQSIFANSQNCNCLEEFNFIKDHIEKNHGGFNKKIKSPWEPAYKKFTEGIKKEITGLKDNKYCIVYLKKYILYLQDHHSNITGGAGKPVNENSIVAIDSFLKSPAYVKTESIPIDSVVLARYLEKSSDKIEGIYNNTDGTYKVALLKKKSLYRDYAGIILESKTRIWTKGQVKFELKISNDSTIQYYGYLRNHSMSYEEYLFNKNQFSIPGWEKETKLPTVKRNTIDNELIRFAVLDSQTTLLSIRNFSSSVYKTLDSVYKKVIPEIKKHRFLVIDVRNNGGGADFSYERLMPLLFTDTIYSDVVDIYNTPGNMEAYRKFDSISVKNGNGAVFARSVNLMKDGKPNSFIPMGTGVPNKAVYPVNKGYPNKIAILYNKLCASSCESLLFDAMYSKKTIFVGENSGGYTGYGDVMKIQTPCGNNLSWTTTVHKEQWKYEFVGIPPQYRIPDDEKDWVDYTRRLLEKK